MRFQTDLIPATLIRRYKRFLSDIKLPDGQEVTAHCPNPGAMTGLADPGMRIWVEPNDDPRKKLKFGWRLSELGTGALAVIDTGIANKVVGEALRKGAVPALANLTRIRSEVGYGQNSRVDFWGEGEDGQQTFIEVKSVTLSRSPELAEFPDTTTKRGAKHLDELAEVARSGQRAVLIYLIQRSDCHNVCVATDIDPGYAAAARSAADAGVEFLALCPKILPEEVSLSGHAEAMGLYEPQLKEI